MRPTASRAARPDPYVRVAPNSATRWSRDAICSGADRFRSASTARRSSGARKGDRRRAGPFGTLAQLQGMRVRSPRSRCWPAFRWRTRHSAATAPTRLRAAATIGLNPVAIWCAAEGHNDALALLWCWPASGWRGACRPPARALVALSALIKAARRRRGRGVCGRRPARAPRRGSGIWRSRRSLSTPLLAGIATQVAPHGHYAPQASLQASVRAARREPGTAAGRRPRDRAGGSGAASRCAARRVEGWALLGLAAWLLVPNPYPWYGSGSRPWPRSPRARARPASRSLLSLYFAAALRPRRRRPCRGRRWPRRWAAWPRCRCWASCYNRAAHGESTR